MKSIKELYKIGPGPSSSHTIGPFKAINHFINENKNLIDNESMIHIILYGSLALTGKGHLTDKILGEVLNKNNIKSSIIFDISKRDLLHPNTMEILLIKEEKIIKKHTYFSIGGGDILIDSLDNLKEKEVYPFNSFNEIKIYAKTNTIFDLKDIVDEFEDKDINEYLKNILYTMLESVKFGLDQEGYLPGSLHIKKIAKELFNNANKINYDVEKIEMLLTSFAYAVSENNASGNVVVTAPTCGSCGIIPSILFYYKFYKNYDDEKLINSLKVASLFGNVAKTKASISGAVHGCQAEIGVASAMGAAMFSYLNNLNIYQIEYASEVALEHFLGLTCDPVKGMVQIPCIERNGIGVLRSKSAYLYAKNISILRKNRVSFDNCVEAMKITGDSLKTEYKETSEGGLAKIIE